MIFETLGAKKERMSSKESLVHTILSRHEGGQGDYGLRFVSDPKGFLLDVATQEHTPHKEGVGNRGVVSGGSYVEVGTVGRKDWVRTHPGQIQKQV